MQVIRSLVKALCISIGALLLLLAVVALVGVTLSASSNTYSKVIGYSTGAVFPILGAFLRGYGALNSRGATRHGFVYDTPIARNTVSCLQSCS